ncbi:MAG: YqgE/AlgH family protein [Prolixibacteraceae bacterium]|jgi:putative transcriptional regulator|nr:YqgE/AlgH family protein [Prolixibacteraceae bacterium]MDD4755570.1 YqgE/AlgH family protein [Prolixibacteraceae bacterium]NLO03684.1 YqgE/AlgH family protein [Bacteroidales bacterium]
MKDNLDIFRIQTNNVAPQKGRVLIAEPFLPGNYFSRSVILLVAYSVKGAVGFIINKKVDLSVQDILPGFPDFEGDVYLGGPVSTDSVYFIHKMGKKLPGSIPVLGDIYWGGDFEVLKQMIKTGLISPSEIRFFVGYSGWESGQLEREIKEDSWLVNDVDEETVMHELRKTSWTDFVRKAGRKYSIWENFPENPAMN